MADFRSWFKRIPDFEGGYVNHPNDRGGCTNLGVTLKTWQSLGWDLDGDGVITCNDIKLLTKEHAEHVAKWFWNKVKGDQIKFGLTAEMLADWYWGSGGWGLYRARRALGLTPSTKPLSDSEVKHINKLGARAYELLYEARVQHFKDIVAADPSQAVFLRGWLNRMAKFPPPESVKKN
ncbi:MAG: hypothetical protein KatS3mg101_1160 [Patescibacteria group bacterium]|nr:MAG: hypothetical protein KatS3mg101_1160 [Patescibacteria group bacterium]